MLRCGKAGTKEHCHPFCKSEISPLVRNILLVTYFLSFLFNTIEYLAERTCITLKKCTYLKSYLLKNIVCFLALALNSLTFHFQSNLSFIQQQQKLYNFLAYSWYLSRILYSSSIHLTFIYTYIYIFFFIYIFTLLRLSTPMF